MNYCAIYFSLYYNIEYYFVIKMVSNKQDGPIKQMSWYILTHFTSKVPYFERPVVASRDHFGGFPEEFGRHYFAAVARQCVL